MLCEVKTYVFTSAAVLGNLTQRGRRPAEVLKPI